MNTMRKRAESKLEQSQNGSWNVMVRPSGMNNDWVCTMSSTDKDMMRTVADWWSGREIEWEMSEDEDE